jgi:hypothetical protein
VKVVEEPQLVVERKLPWLIDIFLYPLSASGIIHLAIFLFIPLLIKKLILSFIDYYGVVSLVLYMLLIGYIFYYLGHCVFSSSKGGYRAPDISIYNTPDRSELISQLFLMFGSVAVCFCPTAVYYIFTQRTGLVFWMLGACGAFFFPMVLLSAVMFDSVSALNPILIIGSIFKTFFPYCGLVLFFGLPILLAVLIISNLPQPRTLMGVVNYIFLVLNYLLGTAFIYQKIAFIYLSMIAAHLLGRFYWWHKDKLGWGI